MCFTVPFDEDDKDKSVWFLDHDYLENMYGMFKKVNGKNISVIIYLFFLRISIIVTFQQLEKKSLAGTTLVPNCNRMTSPSMNSFESIHPIRF